MFQQKFSILSGTHGLPVHQYLVLVSMAMDKLQWQHHIHETGVYATIPKSFWSWGEDISVTVENDLATITSRNSQWQLNIENRNKKNVEKLAMTITELLAAYSPADLEETYQKNIQQSESWYKELEQRMAEDRLSAEERIQLGLGGHYLTYGLAAVMLMMYILMVIKGVNFLEPAPKDLLDWGGNFKMLVLSGDYWRLLSCVFIHAGLIHLLLNVVALIQVGIYLEPPFKKRGLFFGVPWYSINGKRSQHLVE